jgi:hypothetical protein
MVARSERRRHAGRLVLAGLLSAAALATPACGGGGSSAPPSAPGGNVDPAATGGVGGVINKAKNTADAQEQHDRDVANAP